MPHLYSRYTKNPLWNRINKTTHIHTPARSRTNERPPPPHHLKINKKLSFSTSAVRLSICLLIIELLYEKDVGYYLTVRLSNQGSHSKSVKDWCAFGWTIGFVKNVSYYRCGPLTAAYIDKN